MLSSCWPDRPPPGSAADSHLAPFELGEIGPDLFKTACNMGLKGLVSQRRDSRYRPGPSPIWIKVKNPASPATNREL
jgi:bifunctional non-homologous end joining protein LigD